MKKELWALLASGSHSIGMHMYVHDPLVELPRPSAEDPPVEFLRSGAENPPLDLPRPGAETIFFSI